MHGLTDKGRPESPVGNLHRFPPELVGIPRETTHCGLLPPAFRQN